MRGFPELSADDCALIEASCHDESCVERQITMAGWRLAAMVSILQAIVMTTFVFVCAALLDVCTADGQNKSACYLAQGGLAGHCCAKQARSKQGFVGGSKTVQGKTDLQMNQGCHVVEL